MPKQRRTMIETQGEAQACKASPTRVAPSRVPLSSASRPVWLPGWSTKLTTGRPNWLHSLTWRSIL
jgi:hypothetical protein